MQKYLDIENDIAINSGLNENYVKWIDMLKMGLAEEDTITQKTDSAEEKKAPILGGKTKHKKRNHIKTKKIIK